MFSLASMGTSTPWMSSLSGTTSSMMGNGLLDINTGFGVGPLASKVSGGSMLSDLGGEGLLGSLSSMGATMYGAKVATDLLGAFMDYKNYKLQKDAFNFNKSILQENMARQRHEWARQDKNRANISNAWNNGQSFSESLAGYNGDVNKLFGGNAYTPEFDYTFKNDITAKANTTLPTATQINKAKQVQNKPTTTPVNNVSKAA
ncbi:hypothetical protein V2I21_08485 [Campylobacter sp. CLAX-22107-21]|uniref:hypothetical protein n=1 Tax=Campylobacter devanensis TaxID=3161138 RepID=UPI002EACE387|nr:hypothetical protein [Campylobacter sp. CLAX-22107-21]